MLPGVGGLSPVTRKIRLSLSHQGEVFLKSRLGLILGLLVRARVDQKQFLALFQILAFFEQYLIQLAADLRLDCDYRDRFNRADLTDLNWDIPSLRSAGSAGVSGIIPFVVVDL